MIGLTETVDFDSLEKEIAEFNALKKAYDKAVDRVIEIWRLVAKHEREYYEWKKKKESA